MQIKNLLHLFLQLFSYALIIRIILDYIRMFARSWRPNGLVLALFEIIFAITEKPTAFIRKFVPPLRLGGVAIDLSFIILLLMVIPLGHQLIELIL